LETILIFNFTKEITMADRNGKPGKQESSSQSNRHEIRKAKPEASIPVRSAGATAGMVDLSDYYNTALDDNVHGKPGNTLDSLPKGVQKLGSTMFDIRGLIQLAGSKSKEITEIIYPKAVNGIPVHYKGQHAHFLHAAAWSIQDGTKIGDYIINFKGGQRVSVPIHYKQNIMDWWGRLENESPAGAAVAWKGDNERTLSMGFYIRLFNYTWKNPFPELEIETIDFVSEVVDSAPFLIAITIE
jgi:hypothetical protein